MRAEMLKAVNVGAILADAAALCHDSNCKKPVERDQTPGVADPTARGRAVSPTPYPLLRSSNDCF